jgi:hypothetical protein
MPRKTVQEMDALLLEFPIGDRLGMLVMNIISHNSDALAVALRMVRITAAMSHGLGEANRYRVANKMRDEADLLEKQQLEISLLPLGPA